MGSATPLQSLRCSRALTTNSTSCTQSAHSSIGMSAKAWRKASFLKLVRILLHWRKTTKRSASRLLRVRVKKKAMVMSSECLLERIGTLPLLACVLSIACELFMIPFNRGHHEELMCHRCDIGVC